MILLSSRDKIQASAKHPFAVPYKKEVGAMFFFSCNNGGNTGCNSIWQLLSQLCGGFGC